MSNEAFPVPDVHAKIETLLGKHDDNVAKIDVVAEKTDKVAAATYEWSQLFSTPIGKAFGTLLIVLLTAATAYITDRMSHPPAPVAPTVVPIVVPVVAPIVQPTPGVPVVSPIVPGVSPMKVILYASAPETLAALVADPALKKIAVRMTFDNTIYATNAFFPFNGTQVPLPCAELQRDGKTVDVVTITAATAAADVAAMIAKRKEK